MVVDVGSKYRRQSPSRLWGSTGGGPRLKIWERLLSFVRKSRTFTLLCGITR